jgi:uncharacterized protein YcnI
MRETCLRHFSILVVAALFPLSAFAHVTLETPRAAAGGLYKAVLRVPHGCQGSPTVQLRVRVPEGVFAAKPQPKAGWKLETVKGNYSRPYTLHGSVVGSGVKEISWTGGPLPDDQYY